MSDTKKNKYISPPVREFVPCSRIIAQDHASGTETIPGNRILRTFLGNNYPICSIEKGGFLLLDFGTEVSGGVRIVSSGEMKHCRIRLRFGESVSEAMNTPDPDHAIHDIELPISSFSSTDFGNTGFRFIRIDALDSSLALHNVIAICEHQACEQTGIFHSSDPLLNRIFDTSIHTVRLNMQDYLLDGVKRDRLIWGGDMHPETMVILRAFGAVSVVEDTLELLRTHTKDRNFINGFSSYSLWYFLTLHDFWIHSGNDSLLNANRVLLESEAVRLASLVDSEGRERLPPVRFLDWPSSQSPEIIHAGLQPLLLMALRAINVMLAYLKSPVTIPETILKKLKNHVPDPRGNKPAAALQTLSGMVDRSDVLEHNPYSGVSTQFGYYLLLAKQNQKALELVRKYWGAMLDLGATTFWEDFNLEWVPGATGIDELPVPGRPDIHKDFGAFCYKGLRHSLCHGWAAGPAAWCSRKILGVDPLMPGFREIRFQPDLCDLEFAEGTVPTPYGLIHISLKKGRKPEIQFPGEILLRK